MTTLAGVWNAAILSGAIYVLLCVVVAKGGGQREC